MTVLVVLLAAIAVLLMVVAVLRSGRLTSSEPADVGGVWFERSRQLLLHAARLRTEVWEFESTRLLTEVEDETLASLSREFSAFCADAAALSATAPSSMDGRVIRNLGLRARAVGDLYEREVARREAYGGRRRPLDVDEVTNDLEGRLREFELAVADAHTHVELL